MKVIGNIEDCDILTGTDEQGRFFVEWTAKAAVDTDGSGPLHGDPDAQNDTTEHRDGHALNADMEDYIVAPPFIRNAVPGIVMGCQAHVWHTLNGRDTDAVVGDEGPKRKLGELSVKTASDLGINPSPTKGGEERHIIRYRIYPGVPAVVRGVHYKLQAA